MNFKNGFFIGIIVLLVVFIGYSLMTGMRAGSDNQSNTQENSRSVATSQQMMDKADQNVLSQQEDKMMDEKESMDKSAAEGTIVDKAVELEMTTLVEAVTAAGLVETLSSEGPFTVFVPTQQAFDDISSTLEQIQSAPDAKQQLANILTYHVVAGKVMAADVVKLSSAKTVQGSNVSIAVHEGGGVMVNDANVIQTDVVVSNGVIHLIDKVLIPHSN